jgi:dTMP kinase
MKTVSRGLLIALEGVDGSGKSTLAKALYEYLKNEGLPVLLTKEPGGSPLGKILRPFLQDQKVNVCPQAEFLLFAADRAQHFEEVIIPALQKNMLVISDRLADSSLVYQGFGRGLDSSLINSVNNWIMKSIKPDITLYIKINLETALERLHKRNESLTSFEQDREFFKRVIEGFDTLYKNRNDVIILQGEQTQDVLLKQAVEAF